MALHDSDPERRNLMVTSIAFIAYFYAGGELADHVVRLQVINVKFAHPGVLAVIAWFTLFWFVYRYWLTHSGTFRREFDKEIVWWSTKPYVWSYVSSKLTGPIVGDTETGYHVKTLLIRHWTLRAHYVYAAEVSRDKSGYISSYRSANAEDREGEIRFEGPTGAWVALRVFAECSYFRPSFSNYAVPYLLFALVVLGGAWRLL